MMMWSSLQKALSTILVILFAFAISCNARPWSSSSDSNSSPLASTNGNYLLIKYENPSFFPDEQEAEQQGGGGMDLEAANFDEEQQPSQSRYLSRTYLFNWIPENGDDTLLTPTKRNIAIGRGDGFRPGKK